MQTKKLKVYLADDHAILREGLKLILNAQPNYEIVGETGDGGKVLDDIELLKPDLLILDISMPGMTGIEITRKLTKIQPGIKIIILSRHDNEEYVDQLLKYKINGYVLKDDAGDDLLGAIEAVLKGTTYLSPRIQKRMNPQDRVKKDASAFIVLTNREREIIKLVAEGKSNELIGKALEISPRTAKVHRANIMKKLGVHKSTDLVKYAIREGIIES